MSKLAFVAAGVFSGLVLGSSLAMAETAVGGVVKIDGGASVQTPLLDANGNPVVEAQANPTVTTPDTTLDGNMDVATNVDHEALIGQKVYDENGVWIGEISAIANGDVEGEMAVVVDVGGFLGLGEKPVAIAMSDLKVSTDAEANVTEIVVLMTEAELEAMSEYQG